jgi:hypothetical protein
MQLTKKAGMRLLSWAQMVSFLVCSCSLHPVSACALYLVITLVETVKKKSSSMDRQGTACMLVLAYNTSRRIGFKMWIVPYVVTVKLCNILA